MARSSDETASRSDYLTGYGGRWPDVRWPNGARVAVSFVVNYEEGAQVSTAWGDETNERHGDLVSGMPDGAHDLAMDQLFAYGSRAGYWRIFDAFARHGRTATLMVCGQAAERTPDLLRAAVAAGHEPACHGYRWTNFALLDDATEEEREIRRGMAAIERIGGKRPQGFYGRWGPSPHTRAILARLGFLYDSNAYDDDLPFWDTRPSVPILVLPYALDTNDYRFVEGDPWGAPQAWLDYLEASLDILLAEGRRGWPRILNVGLHLRIAGRPGRFWAVERFLEHLATLGDSVWVATRLDIARHWAAQTSAHGAGIDAFPVVAHKLAGRRDA